MSCSHFRWSWFVGGVVAGGALAGVATSRVGTDAAEPAPVVEEAVKPVAEMPSAWSLAQPPGAEELVARIASWLALEPAQASFADRALGLRTLLVLADGGQLASLADALVRRGGVDDRIWFQRVFERWVALAPAEAARWTGTVGRANRLSADVWVGAREKAALAWAKQAFEDAYAWVLGQPDVGGEKGLVARMLAQLAESDPARALALAKERGEEQFNAMIGPLFETWAKRAPAEALRALGPELLAGGAERYILAAPARDWFMQSPDEALAWMSAQPRLKTWITDSHGFGTHLGASNDRLRGFEAVKRVGDAQLRQTLMSDLLIMGWSGDAAQAAGLIAGIEDPALRAKLIYDASRVTFGTIERNLPYAMLLPEGERAARLTELTNRWAEKDPVAALRWLNGQTDPTVVALAAPVQASVLGAIAADEPQTALATWSGLPAGPAREQAVNKIAAGWARQDPVAAAAWLDGQYAAAARELDWATAEAITQPWVERDPAAALAWTEARAGLGRDQTPVYAWASAVSGKLSVVAAADQIGRIADPATRRQALFNHVHRWLSADLGAASAWLTQQTHIEPNVARAWIEEARREATR